MEGWIKLYRDLLEKPIWIKSTPEQKIILVTILLMANHKESEWEWQGEKFKVLPGQFITSLDSIVKQCGKGITTQNVRSALNKFEKYDFLTNKSTKTGRLITVVNWSLYQQLENETNKETNKEVTKTQQRGNKEVTPNKNDKNDKNEENSNNIVDQVGSASTKNKKEDSELVKTIIDYLNQKTGKSYKTSTSKTRTCIHARTAEGFKLDDFIKVIDIKVAEWKGTTMEMYLRPETLFGTKFEGYLNQKEAKNGSAGQNNGNNTKYDFSKWEY